MNTEFKVTKKECHHHATKSMSKPTRLFKEKKIWGFWQQGTCKRITLLENIVTITSYTPVLKIKTSNPCATKKIKPTVNN